MKRDDHHLIQQVLDGAITPEAFAAFQQRLRDEPQLAALYQEYALLHHTLCEEFEGGGLAEHAAPGPARRMLGIPARLAVAAMIVLAAAAWWLRPWAVRTEDVAVVSFSEDAVWQIDGASRNPGGATLAARGSALHLRQGRASIAMESSVTAVVEGPAELTFVSKSALHLSRGRGYFRREGNGGKLTVTTPELTTADSVATFGIDADPNGPDEAHVIEGRVEIVSNGGNERVVLAAGEAARVPASGPIQRFPADGGRFATSLGRFKSVVSGPFDKAQWRLEYGKPSITGHRIEGVNFSAYLRMPEPEPAAANSILLATLDVGKPVDGEFHTDGWAGMSFYSNGSEVLFFGDSFGTKETWALDVKQRIPVIHPEQAVSGPRTVTLRYDPRSGDVSLHEGAPPLKAPFCAGKIPAGIRFDEIRLGASSGAALAVNSLGIRVGGE
jgi:hypothetical protein